MRPFAAQPPETRAAMAEWQIERLNRSHERSRFSCGKPFLDDFIRALVSQYEQRNLGRTKVAVRPGETKLCGYYTLASGAVPFQNLPAPAAKKLPRHPVPTILLARLAVDHCAQGQGLGEALLVDALDRCSAMADGLGVHAVEVLARDASAKHFYEKYGFAPLLDAELHLFLSIATIRDARRQH
jgi:ribosomal protein S18 acetylase RimI-like enzyme